MLLSLGDPSERVVNAVHQVFIPAFAAWTTELGTLHTSLIPSLLARIEKLLKVKVTPDAHLKAELLGLILFLQQGEHGLDEHKLHIFLSALQSLIPPLFAVVLQNAPFSSKTKLHRDVPAIEGKVHERAQITREGGRLNRCLCSVANELHYVELWSCSDPVPQTGLSPAGCGHHHWEQRDAEHLAASLRPPAGA